MSILEFLVVRPFEALSGCAILTKLGNEGTAPPLIFMAPHFRG
jgi:hypothetical protein